MKKLAIISTHPIQYNAPLFQLLTNRNKLQVHVFYTFSQSSDNLIYDKGFERLIEWDIPLREGYSFGFVENTSKRPGTYHFRGVSNPDLGKAIIEWQPDALLVFGWAFSSHLSCLRQFHGKIPVLFRGDSTLLDERGGLRSVLRTVFLRWVYRHVDYALYTGSANRAYFIRHGLKQDQLIYAPHAIDNARFQASAIDNSEHAMRWREQLGFSREDVVLLFAGKLERKKDPFFLCWLARQSIHKRLRFLVAGNGELETALKAQVGNDDRFVFLGFQNQQKMPVVYAMSDIFILPSRGPGETWGLAINEAMACGKPVIASDKCGGAADLVNGSNGIIFNHKYPESVVRFLRELCEDPALLKQCGEASAKHVQKFNILRLAEAVEQAVNGPE